MSSIAVQLNIYLIPTINKQLKCNHMSNVL